MTSSRRHDDGFTLVELLVSLALLSLMTIYSLNALASLRDMNRAVDRVGGQMEVEAVARHLRDAIADVRPVFAMDGNNAPQLLFKGSHGTLEFVTASNGDRETGGLYLLRYSLDADGTLLAERRILRDKTTGAANKVVLLRGVKEITFRYWAPGGSNIQNESSDSWERQDILPSAIEVEVGFEDADFRTWPRTFENVLTMR